MAPVDGAMLPILISRSVTPGPYLLLGGNFYVPEPHPLGIVAAMTSILLLVHGHHLWRGFVTAEIGKWDGNVMHASRQSRPRPVYRSGTNRRQYSENGCDGARVSLRDVGLASASGAEANANGFFVRRTSRHFRSVMFEKNSRRSLSRRSRYR